MKVTFIDGQGVFDLGNLPVARQCKRKMVTQPQIERLTEIHERIKSGRYPNASTLAQELEVCTKSVHRDLEFMRDRLNLPIEYNGSKYGYFYTIPVFGCPFCFNRRQGTIKHTIRAALQMPPLSRFIPAQTQQRSITLRVS